jgi:hypothetical protein
MKESYRENLASSSGHKPYAGSGDAPGVAWVRGCKDFAFCGRPLKEPMGRTGGRGNGGCGGKGGRKK